MKMSVKAKVANGLVICLLMPRAAETASQAIDAINDLDAFRADDAFDFTIRKSHMAVAQVDPEDDPSGGDPSGGEGDPSNCADPEPNDPSGGDPSASAPPALVTAENGAVDQFEVSVQPVPAFDRYFKVISTAPGEARPEPEVLLFDASGCIPQSVTVYGQNDGSDPSGGDPSGGGVDPETGDPSGGGAFAIEIRDQQNNLVQTIPGINLNNDNFPGVTVDIIGPKSLSENESGLFTVLAVNTQRGAPLAGDLIIEPTRGLKIVDYAASLRSQDRLKAKGKLKFGTLTFKNIELNGADTLIVALEVVLSDDSLINQKIAVRFADPSGRQQTDDDFPVRTEIGGTSRSSLR